jgi:hypothetical protein
LVDEVLKGLRQERAHWEFALDGLQGFLTGTESVQDIEERLVRIEVQQYERHRTGSTAAVAAAATGAAASTVAVPATAVLEERIEQLEEQLQQQRVGSQVKPTTDARRSHRCHAIGHIARNRPAQQPFVGQGTVRLQTDPFGVQWMVGSGC